jgi:tripartite-type tricarboxylate transporter receptor subunit TctC
LVAAPDAARYHLVADSEARAQAQPLAGERMLAIPEQIDNRPRRRRISQEDSMDRRNFVIGSAATAATIATVPSFAQDAYPSQPIILVNPFPPGGAADVVGRPFAAAIEPLLKQPVKIETKAGAAGQVGAQYVASAKPDGYTLLIHIVSVSGFAEADRINGRQPKFTLADFIPIARFTTGPMGLYVNDKQPYKNLKELVEDAKKNPDKLIYSSSGIYGALQLPTQLFLQAAGIKMKHLPTNGGGPALTALLGNNSQVLTSSLAAASAQHKAGKIRPLAVYSAKRESVLPDVPTLKELGYDVEFYLWVGMFAPKGTPDAAVTRLRAEAGKAVASEAFKKSIQNIGDSVHYMDGPEFKKFLEADQKRVESAIRAIGKLQS